MKRGNDNSQLRSDEVERLNEEESEERGTFKRASADVLATRKIFKSKRPNDSNNASKELTSNPNPFNIPQTSTVAKPIPATSSQLAISNPFAGFQGLNKVAEMKDTSKILSNNPFAGFQGLNKPSMTSTSSNVITTNSVADVYTSEADVPFAECRVEVEGSEYKKKMRKLNSSFFKWASRQIEEHPQSMWRDGIQDYIRYTEELAAKYDVDVSSINLPTTNSTTTPSNVQPVFSAPFTFTKKAVPEVVPVAATKKDKQPLAMFSQTASTFSGTFAFKQPLAFDTAPTKAQTTVLPPFSFSSGPTTIPSFSSTFSFAAAPSAAPVVKSDAPPSSGFSFGNSLLPAAPTGSIGWSLPSTGTSSAFGKLPSFPPLSGTETAAEAGDDDDGEPILEPEKVLRDANDTDVILLDVPCKLYGYNKSSNEWKDTGKGSFRVTRSADNNKQRMLVRNPIGKLTFNAGFYKGMKIEKVKGGVRFSAFVATDDVSKPELKGFWVKMKDENAEAAIKVLEAGVDSCQ